MTDSSGRYAFHTRDSGSFNIIAIDNCNQTMAMIPDIQFMGDSILVPTGKLQKPGAVVVSLPPGVNVIHGYFYIPGTGISVFLNGSDSSVVLGSVPAGMAPDRLLRGRNHRRADHPVQRAGVAGRNRHRR